MSGQQKRGFRLPWAAERGPDNESDAATDEQGTLDSAPAAVGTELDEAPVGLAETTRAKTRDAAPAASDVPEVTAEAEMIDTDSLQDRTEHATGDEETPVRTPAASTAEPASTGSAGARPARRENPLVAGLVKAMREAAVASRAETTTRLQSEASSRIEAIRAEATEGAAALRKQVDEDIAGIREWSKVEMARIRAETEHRIEERRADAIAENQRHLDAVEQRVEQVQSTVTTYEADMDRFFERLLAENDPARLAALAEQAPEPPDLSGDLPEAVGWTAQESEADGDVEASSASAQATDASGPADALEAAAAAEAEAEATEGLDLSGADAWPAAVLSAARREEAAETETETDGATSRLNVSGLTSVAGISAFKGAVGGLPGVHSVSVSTGERGVFIFTVHHDPETDIAAAISDLSAFEIRITEATGDGLSVTANEPAAA